MKKEKELEIIVADGDYEQCFVMTDMKFAMNCVTVFINCDFEVKIKLRDKKE